ncbi:MAG: hypothetical protein ABJA78_18745 [Ferruginibacter sp.]
MKFFTILVIICSFYVETFAQWNSNPSMNNLLAKKSGQYSFTDGAGGAITTFFDDSGFVYAQHITKDGALVWGDSTHIKRIVNTPTLLNYTGGFLYYAVVSDTKGGGYITWSDFSSPPRIRAQHFNATGLPLWGANGIIVPTTASSRSLSPRICNDTSGGVFISWEETDNSTSRTAKVQHYNSAGTQLIPALGATFIINPGFRTNNYIVSDGGNGVIGFFEDTRNDPHGNSYDSTFGYPGYINNYDIYAQRITSNGTRLWGNTGKPVCTAPGSQFISVEALKIASADGKGGAVIAFDDRRKYPNGYTGGTFDDDIYIQKIDSNGNVQWQTNGIALVVDSVDQSLDQISIDQFGNTVVDWDDRDSTKYYVKSQRIRPNGDLCWGPNGVFVCIPPRASSGQSVIQDSTGNSLHGYYETLVSNPNQYGGMVQKLDSLGVRQWGDVGTIFTNAHNANPEDINLINSDSNSVIATWTDERYFGTGLPNGTYASKVLANGTLAGNPGFVSINNGNWNNPTTWVGGIVPPANALVFIRSNVTVTANATCYAMTVYSGANVNVATGVTLTVLH